MSGMSLCSGWLRDRNVPAPIDFGLLTGELRIVGEERFKLCLGEG